MAFCSLKNKFLQIITLSLIFIWKNLTLKDEFKYQDSSYICSTDLDITFYFYVCVGVGM